MLRRDLISGIKKLKVNSGLIYNNLYGINNYELVRYQHTYSNSNSNSNLQLNNDISSCSSKLISNDEFEKKIRNIVQEEIEKINKTKLDENNLDLETKIKNIFAVELDQIKKSILNEKESNEKNEELLNNVNIPSNASETQQIKQTQQTQESKLDNMLSLILILTPGAICTFIIFIKLFGFPGILLFSLFLLSFLGSF